MPFKRLKPKDPIAEKKFCKIISSSKGFSITIWLFTAYRTDNTFFDHTYFIRGEHNVQLNLHTFYFETDHSFSSPHDYKVAKIITNDLIENYLKDQLSKSAVGNKLTDLPNLNWTGSKTVLTELIYALHTQGIFNNSNADIKSIVKVFDSTFNIDLGDFYHTFLELRSRKINRTKFLDILKETLIRKMDEHDGR